MSKDDKNTKKSTTRTKKKTNPKLIKNEKVVYAASAIAGELLEKQEGYESIGKNEDLKFIIDKIQGAADKNKGTIPRLAFTEQPNNRDNYAGIYKTKGGLLPDAVIKDIRVKDHLIAAILNARGNVMSMFSHFKIDRFDIGLEVDLRKEYQDIFNEEELTRIQTRIERFKRLVISCGYEDGLQEEEKLTLSDYMYIQTKNGLSFGRHGTEIIYDENDKFQYFRPADIGTIYRSVRKGEYAEGIRESSIKMLEGISGTTIDMDILKRDEYEWIQVVDSLPRQAFSSKEMLVQNLYPSTDLEHKDYPVTPMDSIMSSITTHLSIETYQKLYFMNGRASKGMMVLNSDEADQAVVDSIKQEYMASINSVENSFRTPIFGIGKEDKVEWISTTPQKKDGEFEFLYEQVSRNILSAFNMSPDELPGYHHLSRGTNQKTLSESNNEFKLTASRDTGLRPLILKWQDFINNKLFAVIDPELSRICSVKISGLDAQSSQEESLRIQQDQPLHMDMDEILEAVDKQRSGEHLGGNIIFNEAYTQIVDKYIDVNKYMAEKLNDPSYYFNSTLKYKRDEFWSANMQTLGEMDPDSLRAYYAEDPQMSFDMYKMLAQDMLDDEEGFSEDPITTDENDIE